MKLCLWVINGTLKMIKLLVLKSHYVHCILTINCFVGENKSSYTIHPVSVGNAGRYYCEIENQYGVVNSTVTTVTVSTLSTPTHPSLGKNIFKNCSPVSVVKVHAHNNCYM